MTLPNTPPLLLPPDAPQRLTLHNEVHARPAARLRMPALIVYVAVLNAGVSRSQECEHLRRLPGLQNLTEAQMADNFLRMRFDGYTVKWERHTEYTRYSIVQPLPDEANLAPIDADPLISPATARATVNLSAQWVVPAEWLSQIPGQTIAAIQMAMVTAKLDDHAELMTRAQRWFGSKAVLASQIGSGKSWAVTELLVGNDRFERILVIADPEISEGRAGRLSHRLLEMETYRLMALRGLTVAKEMSPLLNEGEKSLSEITAHLDGKSESDQELLDKLVALAASVERATATHGYRFSATRAYAAIVSTRIAELREQTIFGVQPIGGYLEHRFSPAIATVVATEQRLAALSERIARASALLRTRVDIVTELQNKQLLEKLTRGQELQLRLQTTVEGLSIAAISYYVVTLLAYVAKALKGLGLPVEPDIAAGVLTPFVLLAVWRGTRYVRNRLQDPDHP